MFFVFMQPPTLVETPVVRDREATGWLVLDNGWPTSYRIYPREHEEASPVTHDGNLSFALRVAGAGGSVRASIR
jgi:hypothetical protein